MPERKSGRNANLRSSIYRGSNGNWHGRVTMGVRDDGKPDRRHVESKDRAKVVERVKALERQRDTGRVQKPGRKWTVEAWLQHWLENIAAGHVRDYTLGGYRVAIDRHLIPGIGAHRLDKLEPEHLERLYQKMISAGSAPATAHQAHRTVRTALGEAVRRGHITRNPAELAKAPRLEEHDIDPYDIEEIKRLLTAAGKQRNSARWAIALALGLRQGEALGLKWTDINFERGTLTVRRARLRPKYQHGCGGTCGHKRAGNCPRRAPIRSDTAETKSRAGRRTIGLPEALADLLRRHKGEQAEERLRAGQLWTDGGWVFATPTGQPINPRTDYDEWKRLLKSACLRDGRLHDARHTAATVLLLLGVPERAVMSIMGWSTTSMAARYQHLTAPIHADIAKRVDVLLWGSVESVQQDGDSVR